jgi:hypothetical protein
MAATRLAALVVPIIALLHTSAWAQGAPGQLPEPPPGAVPGPPPPPPGYPVYPAPLSQTTQSTYVPQSVALSGPREIRSFDASRPVPAGYTLVERTPRKLLLGGLITLGVTYGVSAMVAAAGEDSSSGGNSDVAPMWIPVAGPFLTMANTDSSLARVMLINLGAAQTAGAIMLMYGLSSKDHVLVRNDLVGSLQVSPMATRGGSGMVLSGRF